MRRMGKMGKTGKIRKGRKFSSLQIRRKFCRFCADKAASIDYKDVRRLERMVSDRGKIMSVRITGTCARHQRMLKRAIKKARFLALLPHIKTR